MSLGLDFPAEVASLNVLLDESAHAWEIVTGGELLVGLSNSSVSADYAVVVIVDNVLSDLFVCWDVNASLPEDESVILDRDMIHWFVLKMLCHDVSTISIDDAAFNGIVPLNP
jgi:hypothetical protein